MIPQEAAPHNLYFPNNFSFLINCIIEAVLIPAVLSKIAFVQINNVVKKRLYIIKFN